MQRIRYYYLIKLQYLGFRYHGWQKQPKVKTVERMVDRTIAYVLDYKPFKILSTGRTDAMVSVNETYIELFVDHTPLDLETFFPLLNKNLPQDIRALGIKEIDKDFNVIQHPKVKEYLYFFSYGEKFHPFASSLMTNVLEDLDIEIMQTAAKLFEGEHDFWSYAFRPKPETQTQGEVLQCELVENTLMTGSFFPERSYVLRVKGQGFKRHQVRLMMGILFELGKGEVDLEFFKRTLDAKNKITLVQVAPASGLILNAVKMEGEAYQF